MMIPGIVARQGRYGTSTPVIEPVNILRDGVSLIGHEFLGNLELVSSGTLGRMNDGILLDGNNIVGTSYARTIFGGPIQVNGAGAALKFATPVALGRLGISAYSADLIGFFEYVIEAKIGAIWTEIHRQQAYGATYNTVNYYDFNPDASVISDDWRWKISGWTSSSNYYIGEVEAFKFA